MLKSSVSHYTSSPVTHYCFKSKVALGNVLIIVSQEGAYCSLRECFSLGMPTYKKLLFKYLSSQTSDYLGKEESLGRITYIIYIIYIYIFKYISP